MIKNKRLGSVIVSAFLAGSLLLSGCSSTTSTKPTETNATENGNKSGDDSTASNLAPYEINAYFLAPQGKDVALVQEELNKLLKKKINATIKLNYYWWDSYQQKQQLAVSSQEKIDIMFSPSWWGFNDYVAKQAWLPLDDLLAKHGKDIVARDVWSVIETINIKIKGAMQIIQ